MKPINAILLILFMQSGYLQAQKICVSVDDLPVVAYGANSEEHLQEITSKLISTFDQFHIPAIGFVNENKCYWKGKPSSVKIELLKQWQKAGYELGNHSYSHLNYHKTDFRIFSADILKGEKITKELASSYGLPYQYFRHPYLRIGINKAKHDSLKKFLQVHGYKEAPVSIDNDDYLFAKAYHVAWQKGDTALMQKIGNDYISYMLMKLDYFEGASQAIFNRNIKHILLVHANKLNADYLDDLAYAIQMRGYTFISMTEALGDPAYETEITKYGDWGISWLDRWALSQGKKGEFFKEDPPTPEYIVKLSR